MIDASAVVLALSGKSTGSEALRARLPGMHLHAPHLVDAEVGNVLRRHERAGLISERDASTALAVAPALVHHRYPHIGPLGERAWQRRHNLTYYDALYVTLAEHLGAPLLTCDARLSRASGPMVRVELVEEI